VRGEKRTVGKGGCGQGGTCGGGNAGVNNGRGGKGREDGEGGWRGQGLGPGGPRGHRRAWGNFWKHRHGGLNLNGNGSGGHGALQFGKREFFIGADSVRGFLYISNLLRFQSNTPPMLTGYLLLLDPCTPCGSPHVIQRFPLRELATQFSRPSAPPWQSQQSLACQRIFFVQERERCRGRSAGQVRRCIIDDGTLQGL
jgi:hypothetical protein